VISHRNVAGNLTELHGSPYLTGGAGVFWAPGQPETVVDGDQQVIVNPEGTLLFGVNAHTNTVAAFAINSDGSLTAVSGSPFPGGQVPISLGLKDLVGKYIVTVVNKDADPNQTGGTPNYTNFNVSSTGVMKMVAGSTYNLPSGSAPAQALERPGTTLIFGIEFLNNDVASYRLSSGKLVQLSTSTPPGTEPFPLGGALHPTRFLFYVALPEQNQIAVYSYSNTTGALTFIEAVANEGVAPCWLAVNAAGTRLYSAETTPMGLAVLSLP
jgi:hypothetical protein